jgi:hypothetical protein
VRILSTLGAVLAVAVFLATSSPTSWWHVSLPLGLAMLLVLSVSAVVSVQATLYSIMGVLPWIVVVGSDFVHAPLLSLLPYAQYLKSDDLLHFVGVVAGALVWDFILAGVWFQNVRHQQRLSLIMTWIVLSSFVAVYASLFPVSYGFSWHIVVALTLACFICSIVMANPHAA